MEGKTIKVWPLIGIVAAAVISIISVFLPLATNGSRSYEPMITDSGGEMGRIVLIGAIIIAIFPIAALLTKKTLLSKISGILSILGGLVLAGIGAILFFGVKHYSITPAGGIYLVFVGAILFFIMGIASMRSKKN